MISRQPSVVGLQLALCLIASSAFASTPALAGGAPDVVTLPANNHPAVSLALSFHAGAVNDVEKRLRQGDDENLGKEALEELMFRGHAYGRLTLGHVSELKKLTLDDVKRQAARVFTRDRLTIGVAGGYTPDVVEKLKAT